MTKYPLFCKDCAYSRPEEGSEYLLNCYNPIVNGEDPWALGSPKMRGTSCTKEREKRWSAKCGMRGKLWHEK